jgi:NnrU protein
LTLKSTSITKSALLGSLLGLVLLFVSESDAFVQPPSSAHFNSKSPKTFKTTTALLPISDNDLSLAFWMFTFASSHIGMSATRERLIQACGEAVDATNIVGTGIRLPSYWPGDDVGKDVLFPDKVTAGRQFYRLGYTLVSFTTLGSAFTSYLASMVETPPHGPPTDDGTTYYSLLMACAVAANTASLTSLVNASPLSLVPGFQVGAADGGDGRPLSRDDSMKFNVRGLTRITRHPLILPVVPWGVANAMLVGHRPCDWLLFGGLAAYAVAGCAAQDLRVIRKEGSVGTVFLPNESSLQEFFDATSFVPFGAVVDGRQKLGDVLREVPWLAVAMGGFVGYQIEEAMLHFLAAVA